MSLRAVADHGHPLVFDQFDVGIGVIENFHDLSPWFNGSTALLRWSPSSQATDETLICCSSRINRLRNGLSPAAVTTVNRDAPSGSPSLSIIFSILYPV